MYSMMTNFQKQELMGKESEHTYFPHQGTGLCILWILVKEQNCSN